MKRNADDHVGGVYLNLTCGHSTHAQCFRQPLNVRSLQMSPEAWMKCIGFTMEIYMQTNFPINNKYIKTLNSF